MHACVGGGAPVAAQVAGGTHHAFADHGEGFCVFNDIAVAAATALRTYGDAAVAPILIIDLDVRCPALTSLGGARMRGGVVWAGGRVHTPTRGSHQLLGSSTYMYHASPKSAGSGWNAGAPGQRHGQHLRGRRPSGDVRHARRQQLSVAHAHEVHLRRSIAR
jgi:hypothetical protein